MTRGGTPSGYGLWLPWLIGPVAWAAHQNIGFVLVPWACRPDGMSTSAYPAVVGLATAATLVLAAAGAVAAWRSLHGPGGAVDRGGGRRRFMAVTGIALCAFSAAGILVESIAVVMLDACSHGA